MITFVCHYSGLEIWQARLTPNYFLLSMMLLMASSGLLLDVARGGGDAAMPKALRGTGFGADFESQQIVKPAMVHYHRWWL